MLLLTMRGSSVAFRLLACLLLAAVGSKANFGDGDFVPAMRRGQFHGVSVILVWARGGRNSATGAQGRRQTPALAPPPPPQHRTHWHDVLAHHCPKFGVDRLVAVPIPQPIGFLAADDYKVQFSFDGAGGACCIWFLAAAAAAAAAAARQHRLLVPSAAQG